MPIRNTQLQRLQQRATSCLEIISPVKTIATWAVVCTVLPGCMGSSWWVNKPKASEAVGRVEGRRPSSSGFFKYGTELVVTCRQDGVSIGLDTNRPLTEVRHEGDDALAKVQILPKDGGPWEDRWLKRNDEGTGVWFDDDAATTAWLRTHPYVAVKFRIPGRATPALVSFSTSDLDRVRGEVERGCGAESASEKTARATTPAR